MIINIHTTVSLHLHSTLDNYKYLLSHSPVLTFVRSFFWLWGDIGTTIPLKRSQQFYFLRVKVKGLLLDIIDEGGAGGESTIV